MDEDIGIFESKSRDLNNFFVHHLNDSSSDEEDEDKFKPRIAEEAAKNDISIDTNSDVITISDGDVINIDDDGDDDEGYARLSESRESLEIDNIIDARKASPSPSSFNTFSSVPEPACVNMNKVTLKFQDGNMRNTRELEAYLDRPILELKREYARICNIHDVDSIVLSFDGELLSDSATPEELEIEDECVLDVLVKSSN